MESRVAHVLKCFNNGKDFNCTQAILSTYCEDFGLDKETALKIACGLGAGMGRLGHTCGAVSGAYLVIGLKHGRFTLEDTEAKEKTYAVVQEFEKRFIERNKTSICRELLQADLLRDDKKMLEARVLEICPRVVKDAAEILESLLFTTNTN